MPISCNDSCPKFKAKGNFQKYKEDKSSDIEKQPQFDDRK